MGQKIPPYALRLGINTYWRSRWFFRKNFSLFLEADYLMRKIVRDTFEKAGIIDVIVERKSLDHCKLIIKTAKPGLIIGRDGSSLKNLIKKIEKKLKPLFEKNKVPLPTLNVEVIEEKKPLLSAAYLAELIAIDIGKGMSTRAALKKVVEKVKNQKGILGIKVKAKGRVDGSTIKRAETVWWGRLPLSKLIADIDYAEYPVLTKYGYVGVKVWLYRGDKEKISEDVTT